MSDQNTNTEERQTRQCTSCLVADVHAHHIQYAVIKHPVTGEDLDLTISKHIQCCAKDGCEVCSTHLEHAALAGVTNHTVPSHEFNAYLQAPTELHDRALFEKHGIQTPRFYDTTKEETLS